MDPPAIRAGKTSVLLDDPPDRERLIVHASQNLLARCPPDRGALPAEIPPARRPVAPGDELLGDLGSAERPQWAQVTRPTVGAKTANGVPRACRAGACGLGST